MPEGRFISRKISVSRQLKHVSLEADFLFGRMIPHLDRDGRMDGDPEIVKAVSVPLRSELSVEIIRTCLGELDTVGLIEWYEVDGLTVCEFPGFARHQKGMKHEREAVSRYPSRQAQGSKSVRRATTVKVNSGSTPDLLRQETGGTPATSKTDSADVKNGLPLSEVKLSKEKLSEVKLSKVAADAGSAPAASNGDGGLPESDQPDVPTNLTPIHVLGADWQTLTGGVPVWGKLGTALKPVLAMYGLDRVRPAWQKFCGSKERTRGYVYFAEHFGDFEPKLIGANLNDAEVIEALGWQ